MENNFMETIQIQLPTTLAQAIRQAIPSNEMLSQAFAEAIRMWLQRRHEEESEKEQALQAMRKAGIVMTSNKQKALAEAIMTTLPLEKTPTRAQVEASLAKLAVSLSAEIITMRGER
jgi:metal-responsive CopG/Arc/MetJ family transcriptional regulator